MLLFALETSRFFVSVINPGHGDVDERVREGGGETINVRRGITERGGTRRDGPNGQSDERCAIIASAKIGSRQDAAGGNITFRGGAQKP